ncbi:MAG: hypothetical protein NDJ89_03500 [Oligoflexia bacterium]|nr:hypothetical protein [Oligoflexia bacterium]
MPDGAKTPRSLNSFGVSGLLGEDCKVYYDNLFTTKHVGRVSDLIAARLREAGADELKLRALLLYGVFQAYRFRSSEAAPEPVLVECGVDGESIAVGVAFKGELPLESGGLAEKIMSFAGNEGSPLLELLNGLYRHADRLIVRVQPAEQIEVVAILGVSGDPLAVKPAPEIVLIGTGEDVRETPKAEDYIELGDLDYANLLNTDATVSVAPPPTGEFLAHGVSELEDAMRLRAQAAVLEGKYQVGGLHPEASPQLFRIKGEKKPGEGSQSTLIKGTPQGDLVDRAVVVIGSPEEAAANALPESDPRVQLYLMRIQELQQRIVALEQGAAQARVERGGGQDGPSGAETAGESGALQGLFKKVWPFKKKAQGESEAETEDAGKDSEQEKEETAREAATQPKAKKIRDSGETDEAEKDANELLAELEKGEIDRTISKAKAELNDIKKDVQSQKAKRWMDGLMGELVQEKARLAEMAHKLNSSIRQKELEFKNREIKLQEEIRKRDESLRQKTHALARSKDQLSQVNMQMEKFRLQSQEKTEESHFRQKYQLSQKLLVASKEEVSKLTSKVDDLKGQLASAQMALKSRGSTTASMEVQTLRTKNERTARQLEELRNVNEQLTARIQQLAEKAERPGKAVETAETPKKLEASMKQLAAAQKDNEQLKLRIEELSHEELRMKGELKRALLEVKNLRAVLAKKAGGSPGKPSGGSTPQAA